MSVPPSHDSSTRTIPAHGDVPRHVAIIMDGNGRWAKRQHLPRIAGHRRGVESVRAAVTACAERGIGYLTLFAFSSENWRRPAEEVALLMQLFTMALSNEVDKLHRNGVRLKVPGDLSGGELQKFGFGFSAAGRRRRLRHAARQYCGGQKERDCTHGVTPFDDCAALERPRGLTEAVFCRPKFGEIL